MHPDPDRTISRLLASVRPGAPWPDRFALSVIPLLSRDPPAARAPGSLREARNPLLAERSPARADAVGARNRAGLVTIARLGEVISGGMADRAVLRSTRIDGDGGVDLPVLPLEPRWWSAGPLRAGRALPAALLALLALVTMGRDAAIRAGAQTALWSASTGGAVTVERRVHGFVLLAGERAVALHVASHHVIVAGGVDARAAGPAARITGASLLCLLRGLRDEPRTTITVAASVPPLVDAWVLDGKGLLSAASGHSG